MSPSWLLSFGIPNAITGPGRHHEQGRSYTVVPLEGVFRRPQAYDKELDITDRLRGGRGPQGNMRAEPLEGYGGLRDARRDLSFV